jgi:hypothetical protein
LAPTPLSQLYIVNTTNVKLVSSFHQVRAAIKTRESGVGAKALQSFAIQ